MPDTISLSSPLNLPCGQVISNRIMKSALSEGLGTSGHGPDIRLERLYSRWASGGYGLVVTGNVMVDREHLGEPGNVALENDHDIGAFRRWAKTTQDGGVPCWMQLNHPGRQANPFATASRAVAPSAIGVGIPGVRAPRALDDTEIWDIVERFAVSAGLAEAAGFNGVQIHAAHGYLLSQFLSPISNHRDDRWGGSIEDRTRLLIEIIRRVGDAVSPGFALGVKLNSADFQHGGFSEDESREVVAMLADERIDLIEISGGSYESPAMMGRPVVSARTRAREAYFLEYAETVRTVAGHVPLAVTGGFRTHAGMTEAIASGACDIVGLGRPTAVSPTAGHTILRDSSAALATTRRRLPVPRRVAGTSPIKALDGALDLQWHTDQLHRMGAGAEPDPLRPLWRTAITTVRRNGIDAFRTKRERIGSGADRKVLRKFRVERAVGRHIANPAVALLTRLGIRTSLATELETTGRRSGQQRRVPVTAGFDATGAWIISQHGNRSGWAINIAADPVVRIRQGSQWRSGTAEFVPDDNVADRARTFATNPVFAKLVAASVRALQSDPISVRISFTDR
ncbi:nitroreductase/quinone reductase family protein [Williamsia sp.]|uniref:nitroreductase/quinone reductase family protein n=1 Tax=Williamsia sp. TaxID=1872085 RepID=UPI002F92B3C5